MALKLTDLKRLGQLFCRYYSKSVGLVRDILGAVAQGDSRHKPQPPAYIHQAGRLGSSTAGTDIATHMTQFGHEQNTYSLFSLMYAMAHADFIQFGRAATVQAVKPP